MKCGLAQTGAVASVALIVGCAGNQRADTNAPDLLQILETLPASGPIAGADVYPLAPGEWRYQIIEGEGHGSELIISCAETSQHDATIACSEGPQRTSFWRADVNGNIVMTAVHEADDDALSLFRGPLLIAPNEIRPGVSAAVKTVMRVVDATDPTRSRESGHAMRTLQYEDDQRIRTPFGEFTAKRLIIHFKADLRMAEADEATTLWVVPGMGIVAMRSEEHVKVLGIGGKKKIRMLALIDAY